MNFLSIFISPVKQLQKIILKIIPVLKILQNTSKYFKAF
jgi:acetolactate synthase small subunit